MRASPRDRRGPAIVALCLALILLCTPAAAEEAAFRVLAGGTAYEASIQVDGSEYAFWSPGLMGERVPLQVEEIRVLGPSGPVEYRDIGRGTITFPEGNYTVTYRAPLRGNHFVAAFDEPYTVTLVLPKGLDVRNPLIGMISPGGAVSSGPNGTVEVLWDRTAAVEVRFYAPEREVLLGAFGTIWLSVAIVLILPLLISRKRDE
ncbi:DUF5803 family protein [Methanoculleus sp. 7T]|uniref:DUF5803 family protein n=1 Tax=Methanoculleus sp. 7T TaxID=2937282 RepID=UPI0020BDB561|nr:DUF5803 family protein [Methanoculleus sp. 7T]MCK8517889.1 DUF5803 family protein [Methanoculleus sp. 7T]